MKSDMWVCIYLIHIYRAPTIYRVLWKASGIKKMQNHVGPKGAYILLGERHMKRHLSLSRAYVRLQYCSQWWVSSSVRVLHMLIPAMSPWKRSICSCLINIRLGHVTCSGQLNASVCGLHPILSGNLHPTGLLHSVLSVPVPPAMRTAHLRRGLPLKYAWVQEERRLGADLNLAQSLKQWLIYKHATGATKLSFQFCCKLLRLWSCVLYGVP